MKIDRSQIRRIIGEPYFSRGEDYFERGRVAEVRIDGDDRISGVIVGSGGKRYRAEVMLSWRASGVLEEVDGDCSCPIGLNCKHVAALLLAAKEVASLPEAVPAPARGKMPSRRTSPSAVKVWLDQWSQDPAKDADLAPPPATKSDRLFYVFRRGSTGVPEIVVFKAYVKKDGTVGANAKEYYRYGAGVSHSLATIEDATILARLDYFTTSDWSRRSRWPGGEDLRQLLSDIVATGRARFNDVRGPALVWVEPRSVSAEWQATETGEQRLIARDDAGATLDLLAFPVPVFSDAATGETGFVRTDLPAGDLARLIAAPPVPAEAAETVAEAIAKLNPELPLPVCIRIEEREGQVPVAVLSLFGVERKLQNMAGYFYSGSLTTTGLLYPCARLRIVYEGADDILLPGEGQDIRMRTEAGLIVIRRNLEDERETLDVLENLAAQYEGFHPDILDFDETPPKKVRDADIVFPVSPADGGSFHAPALAFAAEVLPKLRSKGWRIEIDKSWPFRLQEGPVSFQTSFEPAGNDWFSVALTLEADGRRLNLTPILLQIIELLPIDVWGTLEDGFEVEEFLTEQTLFPRLEDGTCISIQGDQLVPFVEAFLEAQGLVGFHRSEAGRAARLAEALEGCGASWSGDREVLELGKSLQELDRNRDLAPPPQLACDLRPYQRKGYGWLRTLNEHGFGGVLADDMGLGKTVQALALLVHRHLEVRSDKPSLLIVPTSLLGNWRREAERFAPGLKLLILHGPDRKARFNEVADHHLVVTTYPLINRDHEALFAQDYDLVILDEAQAVKNPAASVARRIRDIQARQRIALTGTPMENNLQELWSLYDWLIPGLLGDRKSFNSEYRKPIEQTGDRLKQRQLATRVKPFLMRRTKEEVASDLPPKTVIDEIVPLSSQQAALYESVRSAMDERVRETLARKGLAGSRITILDALLKLRQVCCDPALVKLEAARGVRESAKRARTLELLEELVAEGRKVLVFSQFVEMLRLIESDLNERGWEYAFLYGQTQDRETEIGRFQSGAVNLFLISLKTGGTGLNLTAADTVILYDPWWNPAVERQAMDRAHRLGQDKPVFVYRMIAENSVETAIQEMQTRKQALADALFEGTGEGPLALTEEDLALLFEAR